MSSTLSDGTESLAGSKELDGAPHYLAGGETPYFDSFTHGSYLPSRREMAGLCLSRSINNS